MRTLICVDSRGWERTIRGAARYLSDGEAVLAHVVDERASRGYDLSVRGLLGRRQRDTRAVTSASETAADSLLADAETLLERLCSGLDCQRLVLRGVPGEELARTVRRRRFDAVFVGRGTPGSREQVVLSGTLTGWKRNHPGDVDGFYVDSEVEVHFPPHMAANVQDLVKEGESVEVRGERRGEHLRAFVVTDSVSGASVEIQEPQPGGGPERHHLGHTARFVTDHVACDVIILS